MDNHLTNLNTGMAAESRVNEIESRLAKLEISKLKSKTKSTVHTDGTQVSETNFEALIASMMKEESLAQVLSKEEQAGSSISSDMLNTGLMSLLQEQALNKAGMYRGLSVDPSQVFNTGLMASFPSQALQAKFAQFRPVQTVRFPLDRGRISSHFGKRLDPMHGHVDSHKGVDIAAQRGSQIKSPWNAEVVFVGNASGFGANTVVLAHPETLQPNGKILYSVFGHNESASVNVGDRVAKGQVFATVGSEGKSTGPHLHWETRWAEPGLYGKEIFKDQIAQAVNPLNFA